jgi:hypothetical protein
MDRVRKDRRAVQDIWEMEERDDKMNNGKGNGKVYLKMKEGNEIKEEEKTNI